jgi:hypothetical protein
MRAEPEAPSFEKAECRETRRAAPDPSATRGMR